MASRRARVLDQHLLQLESAERRAARQIAAAYNQARTEMIATLLGNWNPTGIDTPDQALQRLRQLALLDQIDARLKQLERENNIMLRGILNAQAEQGVDQVRRELALLPPSLRPDNMLMFATINERMVERFAPAALDGLRVSTADMGLTLRRELQTGLIQGEAFPTLVTRLLRNTPEGEGVAVFPRARTSAELATRRAVITAENAAKVDAIGEVAKEVPEVQKQAIAALGKGTTDCCLRVHGQIKPTSEPFELTGEPRFADRMMAPAFHWNCRTGVAMYHPLFEASTPTAKMREEANAEQERRKEEREKKRKAERAAPRVVAPVAAVAQPSRPLVDLAYQAERAQFDRVHRNVDEWIQIAAERSGTAPAEAERVIATSFNQLTAEHPMAINFHSRDIDSLLKDGRFKSQFETNTSGAMMNKKSRAAAEESGLGVPERARAQNRPIYGYLRVNREAEDIGYGDITFVLKDDVKRRATVTAGDSLANFLGNQAAGTPMTAPGKASWDGWADVLHRYATGEYSVDEAIRRMSYIEVQVQRGVSLRDVAAVIDRENRLSATQIAKLREAGITIWNSD